MKQKRRDLFKTISLTTIASGFPSLVHASDLHEINPQIQIINNLSGLTKAQTQNLVFVTSYFPNSEHGGGFFVWSENIAYTEHNGGTIIHPPALEFFHSSKQFLSYPSNQNQTHLNGCWLRINENEKVNVKFFGAQGDGTSDDTLAIQSALNFCKKQKKTCYIPAGKYRVTSSLNCFLSSGEGNWGIEGEGWNQSIILADFNGFNNSVLDLSSEKNQRVACPDISNIRIEFKKTVVQSPIALRVKGGNDLKLNKFSVQASNNIQIWLTSMYNSDLNDVVCYYGGHSFTYKNADSLDFSIKKNSNILKASGPHFTNKDIGYRILLDSKYSHIFKVLSVRNSKEAIVTKARKGFKNSAAAWEGNKCDIRKGSNILTAHSESFIKSDIGRTICIQRAGPSKSVQTASITRVYNRTTVQLSTNVKKNVTKAYFSCPSVLLDSSIELGGNTNDMTFDNLQVENFKGVGLVQINQSRLKMQNTKIHADATPTYNNSSLSNIWLSGSDGSIEGVIEGNAINCQGKIYASNLNGLFKFDKLDIVLSENDHLIYEENNSPDGIITFEHINILNHITKKTRRKLFKNANDRTPNIFVSGIVSSLHSSPSHIIPTSFSKNFHGIYEEDLTLDKTLFIETENGKRLKVPNEGKSASLTRIGRQVQISGSITLENKYLEKKDSAIKISGLPFTALNTVIGYALIESASDVAEAPLCMVKKGLNELFLYNSIKGKLKPIRINKFNQNIKTSIHFSIIYTI
jgi:hypothetical protein